MSRRRKPRTPTPGNYLGLKNPLDARDRHDRGRYRGSYARDDYNSGYRRSPRRSPYRGGRDYSPHGSPYGGRSRRDHSRSPRRSPYRSPDRGYGRHSSAYASGMDDGSIFEQRKNRVNHGQEAAFACCDELSEDAMVT